jgi:hypothetical protein
MAFHAILCTRDEDDIIGETLDGFLTWADEIHVFDTGSIDQTWDIVNDLAVKDARIRPVERRELWFSDQLRGYCFEKVRGRLRDGDWFLRTDSDEFYHIPPPEFVRAHLRSGETCVYQEYFDFRMTREEAWRLQDSAEVAADRQKPIAERRTYYTPGDYPEPRMCRYRPHMSWPSTHTFPINAGYVAHKRIPVRHYPNRDPRQLQKRMELRRAMVNAGINSGRFVRQHHWREQDWHAHLVEPGQPGIGHWRPGLELPLVFDQKHLPGKAKRVLQKFLHAFAVRGLDRLRAGRGNLYVPEEMAPDTQAQLRETLRRLGGC